MSDSNSTRDTIVESIKALPLADQWAVMESALKALKAASKPAKAKKEKDPNAPKKEATWWVKRTQDVRKAILDEIVAENVSRKARGEKGLTTPHTTVASMLRDAGKLSKDVMPSVDDIRATWVSFLESPPEPKPKPVKKSAEPSEPKPAKEPKATTVKKVLTDDEKAAKKEKEKATREANKAAKSAEKAAVAAVAPPAPATAAEPEDEDEVAPYEWTHQLKNDKEPKVYERLDYEGKAYLYDNNTKVYLGLFMEKLNMYNKSAVDPLA